MIVKAKTSIYSKALDEVKAKGEHTEYIKHQLTYASVDNAMDKISLDVTTQEEDTVFKVQFIVLSMEQWQEIKKSLKDVAKFSDSDIHGIVDNVIHRIENE